MIKKLSEHQAGLLAVFTAALMWSSGGLFVKLVTFNAMQISFFRCSIAAVVFAVLFRKRLLLVNTFTFINAFFYASVLIAYVIALKLTTAANAIFLQSTAPIYVLIFEPILLKTSYNRVNIITIIVCIIGMFFFFMGKISTEHLEGNLVALFSGIMFAALFLGLRKNEDKYQLSSIFYGNVLGVFLLAFFVKYVKSKAVFWSAVITQLIIIYIWYIDLMPYLWLNLAGCATVMILSVILQSILNQKK